MAGEMRLIDAGELLDQIDLQRRASKTGYPKQSFCVGDVLNCIRNAPTVDAAPVVHGWWNQDGIYIVCSVCNNCTLMPHLKGLSKFNYCPNCGARMDGDGND